MSTQPPIITINEILSEPQIVFNNNIKTATLIPITTGEGNIPFVLNSVTDLVNNIPLTENNAKYWWQAWNYLQYNNDGIYVIRPIKLDDENNYISIINNDINTNSGSQGNLYNSDVAQSLLYNEDYLSPSEKVRIYNRYVSNRDDIGVLVCDNIDDWNQSISNENMDVIRDINRYDYDSNITTLNNIYHVVTKKITSNVKKYETSTNVISYLTFSENLTYIKSGQYLRGIQSAIDEWFLVNSITNNVYRQENITNVDLNNKKITLNGYHGYLNENETITLYGFSNNIFTITNIEIVDTAGVITTVLTLDKVTVTSQNQSNIIVGNTAIIQSNTTTIYTETDISIANGVGYTTVKFLDGDWNIFLKDDNIADNTILQYANNTWETTTLDSNKNYYIYNLQKVYYYSSSVFSLTTLLANLINNNSAVEKVYTNEIYNNDNSIKTFNDLFLTTPNFENNEIGIIVFVKDSNNDNLYTLKERFIVDYSNNSENLIYNNSKYIYYKTNKSIVASCSTYDKSIKECTIVNNNENIDFDNIERYTYNDLKECLYTLKDSSAYNIEYLIGFRYLNSDNNLYSFDLGSIFAEERADILCIQSLYNESDYIGKTKSTILNNLLNTFGINGLNPKQFYKYGTYSAIFGNMKLQYDIYNNKNIWVPIGGDIAGLFVENEDTDISTVGYDLPIKNSIRLLFNLTDESDRKLLNNNGINTIVYNNLKQPVIFESITCTKDLYSITRELHKRRWSNKIKIWFKDNFYSTLLKIANNSNISRLNDQLNSYCNTLFTFGVIKNNYNVRISNNGSTIIVNLSIVFNDIIRNLIFNIKLNNGQLTITESEK